MSEYPIVTNKYASKAEFSANICNDICKFSYVASNNTIITGVAEKDFGESPYEVGPEFGCGLNVQASEASTTIDIEGFDYLGQPITVKSQSITNSASVIAVPFKYITKIKVATGTVTVKEDLTKVFPQFKMTKLLAVKKNGTDVSSIPTLTAPVVTKNENGTKASRGVITLTGASAGDKFEFVGIADNSVVTVEGELVGGLYGNPAVPV